MIRKRHGVVCDKALPPVPDPNDLRSACDPAAHDRPDRRIEAGAVPAPGQHADCSCHDSPPCLGMCISQENIMIFRIQPQAPARELHGEHRGYVSSCCRVFLCNERLWGAGILSACRGGRKKREPCTNTPNRQSYSRSIAIFDPTGTPASCATGWHFAAIRNATGGRSCRSKRDSKFAMPFAMTRV